jgi:cytochrome c oxidase assembly protein subunit 15
MTMLGQKVTNPASQLSDGRTSHGALRIWLFTIAALVFAMIVVGGATRLTDSGLSITEWLPLLGAIPPLTHEDWLIAFEKYKQIPEYELVNKGMTLTQFEFIYWWEWSHRFLGRFIGIAFALPLAYFWITNRIPKGYLPKLIGILALGGLQGFIGWYMVQSGLSERVDVSHYRLALHLTTAFLILAAVLWVAFDLHDDPGRIRLHTLSLAQRWTATILVVVLFAQVVIGAFVAGLKAGLVHNTWPLMNGAILPEDIWAMTPLYLNFLENPATVQFVHRIVAYALIVLALWHTYSLYMSADDERVVASAGLLSFAFVAQASIGVWTLLAARQAAEIPILLGLLHQGGGAIVLGIAVWHAHRMHRAAN